jgi:hypothetical protein
MVVTEKERLLMGAMLHVCETLTEDEADQLYAALWNASEQEDCGYSSLLDGAAHELLAGGEIINTEPNVGLSNLTLLILTDDGDLLTLDTDVDFSLPPDEQHFGVSICRLTEHGRLTKAGMRAIGDELWKITSRRAREELARHRRPGGAEAV